jgi:uncharacterized tellurite resistance protein B-like protein
MFKNLEDFLSGKASLETDASGQPTSKELQVATVTLLAEAARSSGQISAAELSKTLGSLFREFGLSDHDGAELLEISDFVTKEKGRVEQFIAALNKNFDVDQRQKVLSLVWRVLTADGEVDKYEGRFAADLRKSLNLTLEQAMRAQELSKHVEIPVAAPSEEE